ncbi:MAG: radical SAM protein, partial [Parcubacteria group bacterium]
MEHRLTVLHIETTTACNLRCGHCTRVLPDYQVHSMPWEVFEKLIPAMREHQPSVLLNGHGEPLVHPDFRRQFAAVTSCDCSVRFQTNG